MITKVKNLRQSMLYASNFEHDPNTTTGLNFGFGAGNVVRLGLVVEIVANTIAVTDGVISIIYVDIQPSTPLIKTDIAANITSEGFIPLYSVVATSGSITSVTDLRSFTSAQQGVSQ